MNLPELRHQLAEIGAGLERAIDGATRAENACPDDQDMAAAFLHLRVELEALLRRRDNLDKWVR